MDTLIPDKKGMNCHEMQEAMIAINRMFIHCNKLQLYKLQEYFDNQLWKRYKDGSR